MKILNGWTDKDNCLTLMYRENGKKKYTKVTDFDWYFLVNKKDYEEKRSVFDYISSKVSYIRYEEDGSYVRIYYPRNPLYGDFSKFIGSEFEGIDEKDSVFKKILSYLDKNDIIYYEADLSQFRRYVSDTDVIFEDNPVEVYIDLECDDQGYGFEDLSKHRILSCAYKWNNEYDIIITDSNTDDGEKEVLKKLKNFFENKWDIVYAWNGYNYDFDILKKRFKYHQIDIDWRKVLLVDQMVIVKRMMSSKGEGDATVRSSYALDHVGDTLLGKSKVDIDILPKKLFEIDRKKFIEYNIRDIELMSDIEDKTNFLNINKALCNIGLQPVNSLGPADKIDGFMLRQGHKKNVHFRTNIRKKERKYYSGGFVFEPVKGLFDNVMVFDFSSLYPSIIRSFNISPDTKIVDENEEGIKTITGVQFSKDRQGIVPEIYDQFIDKNREKYKNKQKGVDPDSEEFALYAQQEYAWKSFGLSFYGIFGYPGSRYYDPDIAQVVTKTGEYIIKKTSEFVGKFGDSLYGDTDSFFGRITENISWKELSQKFEDFLNELMNDKFGITKHYVKIEAEKFFEKIFFLSKKKYAGLVGWYKGNDVSFIDVRGLEYVRSDSIKFVRTSQMDLMKLILEENATSLDITDFIYDLREFVLSGNLKVDDIIISQMLNKNISKYKSSPIHVDIAKKMKEDGKEVYNGMKVQYIVTNSENRLEGIPYYAFDGRYDSVYYWNHRIYPPLQRILEVVYKDTNWNKLLCESSLSLCTRCRLSLTRTNIVKYRGRPNENIQVFFVGEGPGKEEDLQGKCFVGRSGKMLDKWLKYLALPLDSFLILNLLRCRPPNNRDPLPEEINQCKIHLKNDIRKCKPKLIIAIGKYSRDYFLPKYKDYSIVMQSGDIVKTKKGNPVGVLVHPSWYLRNQKDYSMKEDLNNLKSEMRKYISMNLL